MWTSTLVVACLLAVVVYHAEVPSALLERAPSQHSSKLAEEGTRYASGKVFEDNQVPALAPHLGGVVLLMTCGLQRA